MSTFARIRQFVLTQPAHRLITTRSLLHLGNRSMIDSTMCRMAKSGEIVRVVRGIFIQKEGIVDLPAVIEITMTKIYKRRLDLAAATVGAWKACEKRIAVEPVIDFSPGRLGPESLINDYAEEEEEQPQGYEEEQEEDANEEQHDEPIDSANAEKLLQSLLIELEQSCCERDVGLT